MSFANPTPLRLGATGTLNGWRVRVAGRVVLGVEDGAETYYWNEYHLVDDAGGEATLVFEETESGPEWKLFRAFDPRLPLDVRAAATKKVGDPLNLDGRPLPITVTGTSRVHHIEGQPPEGVEVGDVATYFNADSGDRMLVVSWTGHEIEFYEGLDVPPDTLAAAFGLPRNAFAPARASSTGSPAARGFTRAVVVALGLFSIFSLRSCFTSSPAGPNAPAAVARPKTPAPAARLADGAAGTLGERRYVVAGHAVVEVARVNGRHDRHEYILRDESNQEALLVQGLSGGAKEWHLFRPAAPAPGDTPYDAAARKTGATVGVEGMTLRIIDLFKSKALSADGIRGLETLPGTVQYGFVAREGTTWAVTRWNEQRIQWHRGTVVPDAEVRAALGSR